jgi:hypothetical protein
MKASLSTMIYARITHVAGHPEKGVALEGALQILVL